MTTEKLRELHSARPFSPFTIHLADGRSIPIEHPELLAYAPGGRTAVAYQTDESMEIIDLLLVTSLKVQRPPRANGRRRSA